MEDQHSLAQSNVDVEADLDAEGSSESDAEGDVEGSTLDGKKGLTRINMKDTYGQDLNIIMPNIHRKRVTYETPKLVVEPSFFNQTPVKATPVVKVPAAPKIVVDNKAPDVVVKAKPTETPAAKPAPKPEAKAQVESEAGDAIW